MNGTARWYKSIAAQHYENLVKWGVEDSPWKGCLGGGVLVLVMALLNRTVNLKEDFRTIFWVCLREGLLDQGWQASSQEYKKDYMNLILLRRVKTKMCPSICALKTFKIFKKYTCSYMAIWPYASNSFLAIFHIGLESSWASLLNIPVDL